MALAATVCWIAIAIGIETAEIVVEIGTEINVIGTEIVIGTAAVVITRIREATTKDRWKGNATTGTAAAVVKTMTE